MRVFVAGASGVIGRPLVRDLVGAGHDVVGMTRSEERAAEIRAAGAKAAICDALDAAALREAVAAARPEVVVHQLTALPAKLDPRDAGVYTENNRIRREGTANLVAAAGAAGARRIVAQSIAFIYAREGDWVKDEDAPILQEEGTFGEAVDAAVDLERQVLEAGGLEGLVLRYGFFYGPGSSYAKSGHQADEVRKRRFPIVGDGAGTFSFVHVEDAAAATTNAVERERRASTTSSTTSRPLSASGCRSTRRRSPRSRRAGFPSGSPGSSPGERSSVWRPACEAHPTRRQSASSCGSPGTRAGARGSSRGSAEAARQGDGPAWIRYE